MSDATVPARAPGVLIGIPTFRRSELLPALVAAIRADAASSEHEIRIVVVDNDPAGSARAVATELGTAYRLMPTPGIAAVRQAILDAASDDELTVMIDDDVLPEPGWLDGLLASWSENRPTVVVGFVRYVWPEGTDPWIVAGGFMRRVRTPPGTRLAGLSTGSVLVDTAQVRRLGVRFDVSLGLVGGEDFLFGREIVRRGGTIVSGSDSVARDDVPSERTTRAFVRRRTISQGQARVMLLTRSGSLPRRIAARAAHLIGGVIRLVVFGSAAVVTGIIGDVARNARMMRRTWFAVGRVLGALGSITPEYARTSPSKE